MARHFILRSSPTFILLCRFHGPTTSWASTVSSSSTVIAGARYENWLDKLRYQALDDLRDIVGRMGQGSIEIFLSFFCWAVQWYILPERRIPWALSIIRCKMASFSPWWSWKFFIGLSSVEEQPNIVTHISRLKWKLSCSFRGRQGPRMRKHDALGGSVFCDNFIWPIQELVYNVFNANDLIQTVQQ